MFGRARDALAVAEASTAASAAQLRQAQVAMAANTATAYLKWRLNRSLVQGYTTELRSRERDAQIARVKVGAGLMTESARRDVAQLERQAQVQVAAQQALEKQWALALAELTGLSISELEARLMKAPLSIEMPTWPALPKVPATALERRPDVEAALSNLASAYASARLTSKNQLPTLTLSGTLGLASLSSTVPWSLASSSAWTLLSGGTLKAQREQSVAAYAEREAALKTTLSGAVKEIETAVLTAQQNQKESQAAEKTLEDARKAYVLQGSKLTFGLSDKSAMTPFELNILTAERSLDSARVTQACAYVALYKALGGAVPGLAASK